MTPCREEGELVGAGCAVREQLDRRTDRKSNLHTRCASVEARSAVPQTAVSDRRRWMKPR
jgi:hypothetical protein